MDIRTLVNQVFGFVGSTSVTDEEFATVSNIAPAYTSELYGALLAILDGREAVSDARERLSYFFKARGVAIGDLPSRPSNIFYGAVIED